MNLHVLLLVAAGCALCACSGPKQSVGLGQTAPGESTTVTQTPLSVPPDFDLPVTASNAGQTQQGTNSGTATDSAQSSGEQALLQTAGASNPDPNIRKTVDQEATLGAPLNQDLTDKLAVWQNSSLQPATTGAAPTIKRKSKAVLGIF
jgi:hypothetical protein